MPEVHQRKFSKNYLPRTFSAFEYRSFRFLWPGTLVGFTCRWMQIFLVSFLVWELTDSAWLVALVGFFSWGPMIPFGMLGGVLADTSNRKKILVIVAFINFLACVAFSVSLMFDVVNVWHAYIVVMVSGIGWALDMPSRRSLLLDMLGNSGVTNGLALDALGLSVSTMIGPILAGFLISLVDVTGSFLVVSGLYIISAFLLFNIGIPQKYRKLQSGTAIIGTAFEGISYVLKHPVLRILAIITILMNVLLFTYMPLVPVIAIDVLHVGPAYLGLLSGAPGFGSIIGNLLLASRPNFRHHAILVLSGGMIAMIGLFMFSVSSWYIISFVALFTLGVGVSCFGPGQFTLYMLLSEENIRGKVLGVVSLAIGTNPLGSLWLAKMTESFSPSIALGINSSIGIICIFVIAVTLPILRLPTEDLRHLMK